MSSVVVYRWPYWQSHRRSMVLCITIPSRLTFTSPIPLLTSATNITHYHDRQSEQEWNPSERKTLSTAARRRRTRADELNLFVLSSVRVLNLWSREKEGHDSYRQGQIYTMNGHKTSIWNTTRYVSYICILNRLVLPCWCGSTYTNPTSCDRSTFIHSGTCPRRITSSMELRRPLLLLSKVYSCGKRSNNPRHGNIPDFQYYYGVEEIATPFEGLFMWKKTVQSIPFFLNGGTEYKYQLVFETWHCGISFWDGH